MLSRQKLKRIGTVAKESGIPIRTIRYYDELGLLKTSGRTEGGYRLFNSDVFARLKFIKRSQSLGLSLLEIKEFLEIRDRGELPCHRIEEKLKQKLLAIEEQIQQLNILKEEIEGLLSGWKVTPARSEETICPIFERTSLN